MTESEREGEREREEGQIRASQGTTPSPKRRRAKKEGGDALTPLASEEINLVLAWTGEMEEKRRKKEERQIAQICSFVDGAQRVSLRLTHDGSGVGGVLGSTDSHAEHVVGHEGLRKGE